MVLAAVALGGCGSATATTAGLRSASQTGAIGTPVQRAVPSALRRLPLTNQDGRRVTLASWPGKTVMLVPFLTLCQDICPMTTGNLAAVASSLRADHAADEVQIVELTVDPGRDAPARLKAYERLTGSSWQLVTESPTVLHRLQKFFGFYFQKVPEDDADARDWWTGKPLTYDVDHSDNYFVIDPAGVERVIQAAAPDFNGKLNPKLYKFLDALGRQHLRHPAATRLDARRRARRARGVGRPSAASVRELMRRRWIAALLALSLAVPAAALGDADPASDVLLGTSVFYPYQPPVPATTQKQLNAMAGAAAHAHFPVKIAIIASPIDLGAIPNLFGQPQQYAKFLDQEISFQGKQPLLVVMPAGWGSAGLPAASAAAVKSLPPPSGKTGQALANETLAALPKLAAAAGHPIASVSAQTSGGSGAALRRADRGRGGRGGRARGGGAAAARRAVVRQRNAGRRAAWPGEAGGRGGWPRRMRARGLGRAGTRSRRRRSRRRSRPRPVRSAAGRVPAAVRGDRRCSPLLGLGTACTSNCFGANRWLIVASGSGRCRRDFLSGRIGAALRRRRDPGADRLVLVRDGLAAAVSAFLPSLRAPAVASDHFGPLGGDCAYSSAADWSGLPAAVPLARHAVIVFEVGPYVPPHQVIGSRPGT